MSEENKNAYILPTESAAEMSRLIDQDRMATRAMDGLFPTNIDLSGIQHVLDVACGPGGWAQEVAFHYPEIQVTGIDISQTMTEYARTCAKVQNLENATFEVMDATQPLQFPDASFDIVNARAMIGFLNKASWPGVISEFVRITQPGGFIVLTETDSVGYTNAPAFETLSYYGSQALLRTGHSFHPRGVNFGITPLLGRFLQDAGCQNIQQRAHVVDYSAGSPAHQPMCANMKVGQKLIQPLLVKLGLATQEELDTLYNQSMAEMMSDDFRGLMYILSVWGSVGEKA